MHCGFLVSFKCDVKGYQECCFDVKEAEDLKVFKKNRQERPCFLSCK